MPPQAGNVPATRLSFAAANAADHIGM